MTDCACGCKVFNSTYIIEIKTRPIKVEINRLKERLDSINTKIISLEDKMKNSYRISVNNAFESLNDTLERHIQSIPKEISKPNTEEDLEKEKEIQEYMDKNSKCIESVAGGKIKEYSAPVGVHPQPDATNALQNLGIVAYYYTGDMGSAPNRHVIPSCHILQASGSGVFPCRKRQILRCRQF